MITDTQFEQLLQDYVLHVIRQKGGQNALDPNLINDYRVSFQQAIAFIDKTVRDDLFNLAAMGASDETTRKEQQDQIALLDHFLDAVIQRNDGEATFYPDIAPGVKAMIIDPALSDCDSVYIYDALQNLSLREKYIRGILTKTHWLTDLDLQRMVRTFGIEKKIKIMPFTKESVGSALHFVREDNANESSQYTISLLLNKGGEGDHQGIHWLAAAITIDPVAHKIRYQIDDSLRLSDSQTAAYQQLIKSAIQFDDGFHSAFPGWTINVADSPVIGSGNQQDGYSCGYRALHTLLQDPDIRTDNIAANAYAQIDAVSTTNLVKAFYEQQLQDLYIPRDIYNVLGAKESSRFQDILVSTASSVAINGSELSAFLNELPANPILFDEASTENTTVGNFIRSYSTDVSTMRFPPNIKDNSLDAIQYEHMFKRLSQIENVSIHPLPLMVLSHADNATLDGINAFFAQHPIKLFKELKIDIDLATTDDVETFMAKLKFSLNNLAHSDLNRLILADNQGVLTQEHVNQLQSFMNEKKIAVAIDLPDSFRETGAQRELDSIVEINKQLKNQDILTGKITAQSTKHHKETNTPIRTRERIDLRHTRKIDIELQEGIEDDVAIEKSVTKKRTGMDHDQITILRLEQLKHAVKENDFSTFQKTAHGLSKASLVAQWHTVFGNIVLGQFSLKTSERDKLGKLTTDDGSQTIARQKIFLNKELSGISTAAFAKINECRDSFPDGINTHQLPAGFLLISDIEDPNAHVLHYTTNIEPQNTIAPKLATKSAITPLSMSLTQQILNEISADAPFRIIWQKLQGSELYSREDNESFRRYLPQVMTLRDEQKNRLITLCTTAESFDITKFKFIFDHLNEARASYTNPYDETELVDTAWMSGIFPSLEDREHFVTLANDVQANKPTEHPLFTLLTTAHANTLLAVLNETNTSYSLTNTQLNALLSIYDRYGSIGLETILNTWTSIPKEHLPTVIKNVANYESILFSDDLLNAIETINGFQPIQRQWWDALYQAHQPKDDNLIHLVQSFKDFSKAIEAKGLTFYSIDKLATPFLGAKNMPTALGRMLSILDLSDPRDKNLQWHALAQINLSAQGALRALTNGGEQSRACHFVIPEIDINPKMVTNGLLYDTAADYKKIATAADTERRKQFYRFIAHQKYRLPLSFYQEAVSGLERLRTNKELPEPVINQLYALLLEATTGDNCRYFINDLNTATTQWNSIINDIKAINLPRRTEEAKEIVADQLIGLEKLPALPVLAKLVGLITKPLQNPSIFGLPGLPAKMQRFAQSNFTLNRFVQFYGPKMYLGMKFYTPNDFSKKYSVSADAPEGRDLFEEFLAVSNELNEVEVGHELLPLISTFHINTADAKEVAGAVVFLRDNGKFYATLLNYALELFQDLAKTDDELNSARLASFLQNDLMPRITTEQGRFIERYTTLHDKVTSLSLTDTEKKDYYALKSAMERWTGTLPFGDDHLRTIANFSKAAIQDAVAAQFKDYFPPAYFETLKADGAAGDVALRINDVFKSSELKTAFERIRIRYHAEPKNEMIALLDSLETILSQLDSHHEKLHLLTKLFDDRLLSVPVSEYNQLLTEIAKHGNSAFVYFMETADKVSDTSMKGLALKAGYFIGEALPRLRIDLKSSKQLDESDVIDLAASLILSGKDDDINTALPVNPKLTQACQHTTQTLSSLPLNPNDIERVLQQLQDIFPPLECLPAISDLKKHLTWLSTTETVTVSTTEWVDVTTEKPAAGLIENAINAFNYFTLNAFKRAPETEIITERQEKIVKKEEIRQVVKNIDNKLVTAALDEITKLSQESTSYTFALSQTFALIQELVAHYPAAKSLLLPLTHHYLSFKPRNETLESSQIEVVHQHLALLHNEFLALDHQDLIIGLCEHFSGTNSAYDAQSLLKILNGDTLRVTQENAQPLVLDFAKYKDLKADAKKQVFLVIASLLNNNKPCSLQDIQALINGCDSPDYVATLKSIFKTAPFPTLDRFNQWVTTAKTLSEISSITAVVEQQYKAWSKQPVAREEAVNGFHLDEAKKQAKHLQGVTYSDQELEAINNEVKAARELDTDELLRQIRAIKQTDNDHPTQLVALMAELLYRTKGLPQEGVGESRKWGRSFEINTTQYLAIHSMLKAGGHVTSQIGTGEGKSRIMMISIACQYALGRTVDFVTADASLATRDYLEYQSFFKALGAKTNLITASTPADEYRMDGINFSDAPNLSLFRNKARSEGKEELVIASNPAVRALMLDEADKTYFDASDTRFNYSAQANPTIRDMPWVYELMVEFFSESANRDLYDGKTSDADRCNHAFKEFARSKLDNTQIKRLEAVSVAQLEAWESSALTALSLEFREDFTIRPNITTLTKYGPKQVSQAQLITGLRASEQAKFSFGVHQCLHARLNQERKKALEQRAKGTLIESLTRLQQQLIRDDFKYPFFIDSENQIVYSSTSKSLLDDYTEGQLLAVTGTAGSIQEKEEAKVTFGSQSSPMSFIDVPRHRGQKRIDLPVALARDEAEHNKKILSSIRDAIRRNQPILLVCENDKESEKLHLFLDKNLTTAEKTNLTRVGTDTTLANEAAHVTHTAGKAGAITVTTAMLGRGTDIPLHDKAKNHGLCVLATYLPRERDYFQIIGRSGRFGAKGDSRLLLNKERLKSSFNVDVLPCELYTATESYLRHQRAKMDVFAQKQRTIKDAVGDFRLALTNEFFKQFYVPVCKEGNDNDSLLRYWQVFFDNTDKAWNDVWKNIGERLTEEPINKEAIETLLSQYQILVQEEWNAMRDSLQADIREGNITCSEGAAKVDTCLRKKVGHITLGEKAIALMRDNHPRPQHTTIIADCYDDAFIGRAVIYKHSTDGIKAFFNNIAAAWRGDGPWFPNLKAAQSGHMSWSQFFLGTGGKPLFHNEELMKPADKVISQAKDSSLLIQERLSSSTHSHPTAKDEWEDPDWSDSQTTRNGSERDKSKHSDDELDDDDTEREAEGEAEGEGPKLQ